MADKQYTNLDKEGLVFLLTLLNTTLTNEFSSIKNDIASVKPQDTVTETGEKSVKSSGIYSFVNTKITEAINALKASIEGNAVSELLDTQTYTSTQYPTAEATKSYVTKALSLISTVSIEVLEALPPLEEARQNVFYFIPASTTGETNYYDEYVYVPESGAVPAHFELIGTTAVDLSGYVKSEQLHALTNSEITEIYNSVFTTT